MHLSNIIEAINDKLAGEQLVFDQLRVHLDSVIDDINAQLNSCFPTFTEIYNDCQADANPVYACFPDRYIRSVVIPGAAYKFYVTDEEGAQAAPQYRYDYTQALFLMQRDYTMLVPPCYQVDGQGSFVDGDRRPWEPRNKYPDEWFNDL